MPRNHGHTAILAIWSVHLKIRTIFGILTILSILQVSFSQKRSTFDKGNDKDYLVERDETYGRPVASLSIFVKGDDNETSDTGLSKETFERSKERGHSRWWREKEEKVGREVDLRKKGVNKVELTILEGNTVKRTIGKEYLDTRSFKRITTERTEGMKEVKENEENEGTEERGNNEESSRSKEDRNSNNFMTKPGTPRNRRTETEEGWSETEGRPKGGRRSSWILHGTSIKRSIREDATRGEILRKGEMSFSTVTDLDDDLRRAEEEKRRRARRERKRRRRETNSSFEFYEWKASNRSVLEKRKVRIDVKEREDVRREGEGTEKKKEIKTVEKQEGRKFITTTSSRDEWQEENGESEKRTRRKNGNVVENFGENLWQRDKKSNVSLGRTVDNFSEDTTFSYLSKKVRKFTQRKEDAPNRVESSKDSGIPTRYRDNTPLAGKAIGFRLRKETEDKNRMTTRRGNLLRDKIRKEGGNVDLKPRKKNVLIKMHRSGWDTERVSKEEVSDIPELATVPSVTIKSTKRDENWIGKSEVVNGNESFSLVTTMTLLKNISQEKGSEKKDRDDEERGILSATSIYFPEERKEKDLPKNMRDGKEGVSRSVGNTSENTTVYRNSTYPNHDTFESSWVYSIGLPIVESTGRGELLESTKDSKRNVGDSVESSESPRLFETFPLPRSSIASIARDRDPAKVNSRTEHHGVGRNRENVHRYAMDKEPVKKYQGVTSDTRDSRMYEKKAEREENTTDRILLEYFPRSMSLKNSGITSSSWMVGENEETSRKTKDREVSDYEKEINDTGREPLSGYKFELRGSSDEFDATLAVSAATALDDIREKLEGNDDGREEKDRKVERLKEEDIREESSGRTTLSKSKRSKSIELTRIGGKNSSSSGNTGEDGKSSARNQETKMDESVDSILNSRGNARTSVLRRDTTETTVESSVARTSTISSDPLDRSISVTGVQIEEITSISLVNVSPKFPSDRFNTIVSTSTEENVRPSDITESGRISWEETTIYNVSYKQSIGPTHNTTITNQWPVKHSAVVEGDLVLGGLMMVHEREDTITCGPVMPQGGVQALEAMLYTLDTLNQREIVPGVKIGAHILDDCDKDTYGLEMAVDFIKGSISNIDGAEYHCNKTTVRKVISGVVGAASSVTSIQVANLLRLFRIPQVSFFSTSPELSNKQRFEYFTRTIPSDHYQVKAMVDIVLKMGWSYVSIIYEESNYGIKAFEELEELLTKNDICIAVKEKLVKDSGVAEETAYDNIVLKLLTKPRAKGCIIFGSDQEVAGVMRAVRRCNATGAFSWIGSDGWSARGLVSNGNEAEVEGTLSVQPQANPVRGFEEYFLNLTVENNRRNPWFVEFWEDHFQCRYPNSSWTPYNKKYTKTCSTTERLTKENTVFEDQLQFVSDAVMAFAYAFRDMHKDLCDGKAGLCDTMKPTKGTELLRYLRKVNFEGLSGDKFRFDKNGDGPARYNIIHFKQTEPGVYKWIRVGKYLEGVLHLNMSMVQFKLGHNHTPESVCSLPCEVGQAKKYVEGESCCWHCFNCSQYQIRHPDDETQCKNCRQGTVPDETHSTCREIPEEFLRLESGWAIGAMSFSAIGILVTLFVCGVFLKHNDTPVVRASGRELSYVLLTGILLCYLVTFALVLRPTDLVCSIQRFGAGFCFTVVYAALLTKTNRISRIFNAGKHSAKRPSFISPRSQLIICSGLVGIQILINGVWIVIDPAKAMHHYPTKEDNLLVCNSYIDASYMIAFTYPIMLIVVCTVYAVLTRKIPEAFNESKYIGFTMYTTCVIWLAFVPLYFGTGNHVALRITSMSVTISLSASVTIACLFTPKLYIILIRPERNVRQNIMPPRPYNTTKSSAVTGTNVSSMMAPVTLTAVTCDQNKAVKKHIITTIDCSTQSEYYELEVKELKNGTPTPNFVSRSTQTQSNNNEKEPNDSVHHVDKESKDNARQTNNTKIGNGPVNQNDVSL